MRRITSPPRPARAAPVAWIYIRESDPDQLSGHSPEAQERLCRELAATKGLAVERVVWEAGTARTMRQRKSWQMVHKAIKRHQFDALLVWKYNRLHRNFMNQVRMLADARASGVEIYSVVEPLDSNSKYGKAMLAFIGIFNEMTSDEIREQTMAGTRQRVEKGMPLVGRKAPYGYVWVMESTASRLTGAMRERKVRLESDPVEAPRVVALWEYLDHPDRSYGMCAAWLNAQGWPSPGGGVWNRQTIRYLVQNSYYWGEPTAYKWQHFEVPVEDEHGEVEMEMRPRPRAREEQIDLPLESVPPLVNRALADRVRARLADRRLHHESPRLKDDITRFLLTGGLLRCTVCGNTMAAKGTRYTPEGKLLRRASYVCAAGSVRAHGDPKRHTSNIVAQAADRFAAALLFQTLMDSTAAEAAVRRLTDRQGDYAQQERTAQYELEQAEKRLDTLKRMATGLTDDEMEEFRENFRQARGEIAMWSARLAKLAEADQTTETQVQRLLRAVDLARKTFQRETQERGDTSTPTWLERTRDPDVPWSITVQERAELREMLFSLGGYFTVTPGVTRMPGRRIDQAMERVGYAWPVTDDVEGHRVGVGGMSYDVQKRTKFSIAT